MGDGRLTHVVEVAKRVRQLPSVQKYCLMSSLESFQGEFSVICCVLDEIVQGAVLVSTGSEGRASCMAGAGKTSSSYAVAGERADAGPCSISIVEPALMLPSPVMSPNRGVASNSALMGSSSISSMNRGVSGMAKRNATANTPGMTPRPITQRHMVSTVRTRSSSP
jgi:hypothetical protein